MNKNPKFSIIIPVFNVEKYISFCIESLINQSLKDIEIICVNDGSTDDSLKVLNSYAEIDDRIIIVDKCNGGSSSARNAGLDIATGEYVIFVDADDFLEENACDRLYMEILQTGVDVVTYGVKLFPMQEASKPKYAWFWDNLNVCLRHYNGDCINALFNEKASKPFIWNKCFNRKIIEDNNLRFDESIHLGEDSLFLFEIFPHITSIVYIPDILYEYRCSREGSLMKSGENNFEWKMSMHIKLVNDILLYWSECNILTENAEQLYSWCTKFLSDDILDITKAYETRKETALLWFQLIEKYDLKFESKRFEQEKDINKTMLQSFKL